MSDPDLLIATSSAPIAVDTALPHDVVVLPSQINGDTGVYDGRTLQLVKRLRVAGVDAAYLHDADHRQWNVLMGDVPTELVIGFVTGVASSATWAVIQARLGKIFAPRSEVRAHVLRQRRDPDGTLDNAWFQYEGPVEGFIAALPHIDPKGEDG